MPVIKVKDLRVEFVRQLSKCILTIVEIIFDNCRNAFRHMSND